jgi:hypothetical protein
VRDGRGPVHARRLWGIWIQLIPRNDSHTIRAPISSERVFSHSLVQLAGLESIFGQASPLISGFF